MADAAQVTTQLRRYALKPGVVDDFLPWWRERLVPARLECGFTVEFGYAVRSTNEFIWAVTVEGDAEHFAEVEASYLASDARAAAFDGTTPWTDAQSIELVERAL